MRHRGLVSAALAWLAIVGGALFVRGRVHASRPPSLEVELSGCAAITRGPVCELPADGHVRAWARAARGEVTFEGALVKNAREVQGGTLFHVEVDPRARELTVVVRGERRSFATRPQTLPPWLAEARKKRQSGEFEAARQLAGAALETDDRAYALGFLARLDLASGEYDSAFSKFREAVTLHRDAGRLSDAADDAFALAFALNQRSHRYAEARDVLDAARADIVHVPDGRARAAYYRGQLAMETGDPRRALVLLRRAREHAARLGLEQLERHAINTHALQLELLGRTKEALAMLATIEGETPCEKAEIAINRGWGALLANERAGEPSMDAVTPLEGALSLMEAGCPDTYLTTAALNNLALAELQRGNTERAKEYLIRSRARAGTARATEVLFLLDLEGRVALARGDVQRAFETFEEEERLAHATVSFEAQWRAAVGKGEALERMGRQADAVAEYQAAEALLTEVTFLVPLGEGRGTFLGDHEKSARALVDLLVRMGRHADAMTAARISRSRIVATLAVAARVESFGARERARFEKALGQYREQRARLDEEAKDDWKLSRNEAASARARRSWREYLLRQALDEALTTAAVEMPKLSLLRSDATTLVFHPTRDAWVAFVMDSEGISSHRITDTTLPGAIAPIRDRLVKADLLRVLPYGPLSSADFHAALPEVPVEYVLDVPLVARARRPEQRAVVVFNPTLDLRSTKDEADHVIRALDARKWKIDVLGESYATSHALVPLLARADFFHYAGHGVFAGREGWESALPLAANGHLALADVLALAPHVPRRVVLSGCETAKTSEEDRASSLGIAQAFIVAGAEVVIAPSRPVDDALAARFARALYGEIATPRPVDVAAIVRDARARLRKEDPNLDWDAFRVITR